MRVYKLQATVAAGSNDSIAQLDIVEDGKIRAVQWAGSPSGMDLLSDHFRAEISFSSSNTLDNNDVRQSISGVAVSQNFLTSGGGATSVNQSIVGLNLNVIAGERIHMHSNAATGVGGALSCYIYVEDGSGGKTRSRRLR